MKLRQKDCSTDQQTPTNIHYCQTCVCIGRNMKRMSIQQEGPLKYSTVNRTFASIQLPLSTATVFRNVNDGTITVIVGLSLPYDTK